MKKKSNLYIFGSIALAIVIGFGIYAFAAKDGEKLDDKSSITSASTQTAALVDTNSADYKQYAAITGDEYDRLFVANMIAHHQGAVDMANVALTNASHKEVKDLANAIVSAQTSEITSMSAWQSSWGYPASSGPAMTDHSAMMMMDTNGGMMTAIMDKTGEAFDKAFLEQMIMHHQSAINMAATGKANAKHQELKDLTVAIVTAQTKEIEQMKQWQKAWGYTN